MNILKDRRTNEWEGWVSFFLTSVDQALSLNANRKSWHTTSHQSLFSRWLYHSTIIQVLEYYHSLRIARNYAILTTTFRTQFWYFIPSPHHTCTFTVLGTHCYGPHNIQCKNVSVWSFDRSRSIKSVYINHTNWYIQCEYIIVCSSYFLTACSSPVASKAMCPKGWGVQIVF